MMETKVTTRHKLTDSEVRQAIWNKINTQYDKLPRKFRQALFNAKYKQFQEMKKNDPNS